MKKIIFTVLLTLSLSTVGLAAPITDYSKDKLSIDVSYQPSLSISNDIDIDGKTKDFDFGITAALSEKWGIQYIKNNFKSDTINISNSGAGYSESYSADSDMKVEQINLTYNCSENTVVFVGYTRNKLSASYNYSIDVPGVGHESGSYSSSGNSSNGFQVGVIEVVPVNEKLKSYGVLGIGDKLFNIELGLSQELSPNVDLNLFYKYMKLTDINLGGSRDSDIDIDTKGLGFGVTCKF